MVRYRVAVWGILSRHPASVSRAVLVVALLGEVLGFLPFGIDVIAPLQHAVEDLHSLVAEAVQGRR